MILNDQKLFIITGPSGVGKGTVIKTFLGNNDDLVYSVSSTTRPPREDEINGVHYNFVSKEDFEVQIKNNEFLEWAEYNGNYYGTNKNVVNNFLKNGKNVILEIETKGAMQVMEKCPKSVSIFILPPDLTILEARLRGRKTESEEVIQNRLNIAKTEISMVDAFKYKVINDEVQNAVLRLQNIYESEKTK